MRHADRHEEASGAGNDRDFAFDRVRAGPGPKGAAAVERGPAVMAVRAGADLVMGAARLREVAEIVAGFRRAIAAGAIRESQIDSAVRRELIVRAALVLLPPSAGQIERSP